MGIHKLLQDLSVYTEEVFLGRPNHGNAGLKVTSIVIDGPSLVYHVYQRLMGSISEVQEPLTYRTVNVAVVDLLDGIRNHNVDIKKIYFDGALPVSKRKTRLVRLERHRRELEKYAETRPMKQIASSASQQPVRYILSMLDAAHYVPTVHNLKALEPPFMVASVIEHLNASVYASVVEIIPDEAEVGCVMHAFHEGAAMLSNDSDLVVYPAAKDTKLVLLGTLRQSTGEADETVLLADCLRPSEIERRLQLTSLSYLAFERANDPSVSPGAIKVRAQETMGPRLYQRSPELRRGYEDFIALYQIDFDTAALSFASYHDQTRPVVLDPRLSELYCQYRIMRHVGDAGIALHMYLPTLFEDPTRESPWAHGSEVRQSAYSLLNLVMRTNIQRQSLFEYQRRGYRVSGVEVNLSKTGSILDSCNVDLNPLQSNSNEHPEEMIASWLRMATQAVQRKRRDEQRMGTLPAHHLRACVQAVLYSFRLLKQVTALELVRGNPLTPQSIPPQTLDKLVTMPALAALMDSMRDSVRET